MESIGLTYHTADGIPYWDESAYYEFSAAEVDRLVQGIFGLVEVFHELGQAALVRVRYSVPRFPTSPNGKRSATGGSAISTSSGCSPRRPSR